MNIEKSGCLEKPIDTGSADRIAFITMLKIFLRLGLTSFGGPVAHLGYFRNEFVVRRKWLTESAYADLVALCNFLPGPASSQVGFSVGLKKGGLWGGLAAWLGFTLPSAFLMIAFAYGVTEFSGALHSGWLRGLKIAAVAVVAHAVWGMAAKLCPDRNRATLALASAAAVLTFPTAPAQILVILIGAAVGYWLYHQKTSLPMQSDRPAAPRRRKGLLPLILFFGLLVGLPLVSRLSSSHLLNVVDAFYRAGALVFGGGHVVLPLLQASVVPPGWLSNDAFLAGYGAAQAVPGPLFTFAAYLGSAMEPSPHGWLGGLIALVSIFLPALLLVLGVLPLWELIRVKPAAQSALLGTNAAVVGILLAALYTPVWREGIHTPADFIVGLGAFGLLQFWRSPSWLVVGLCAGAGFLLG
jgi:chromate transporter